MREEEGELNERRAVEGRDSLARVNLPGLGFAARQVFAFSLGLQLTLQVCVSGHTHGRLVVKEGSDAVLLFSLENKQSIEAALFDWRKAAHKNTGRQEVFLYNAGSQYNNGRSGQSERFKGRVSHFPEELKNGNASIIIKNTEIGDTGNYTCINTELVVEPILRDRSGKNKAATPKPRIRTLDATDDRVLLQCEVRGASPKPRLQWQDSAGNKLPAEEPQVSYREDHDSITLNINVTKSDRYRCVITQDEIHHQTHEETLVHFSGKVCEDSSRKVAFEWLFGSFVFGVIFLATVLALLTAANRIKILHNKGSPLQDIGLCKNRLSEQGNCSCE
ncbi:V-set domain containing T-cell activation inhibitor 1-like [Plectropomus leopardus]|uniref:V-set domain containing T-cell activation inhibitor 1-like n=1 Tax=Plectropomus leopardus TaxID=160734 RepID=UPI001C4C1A34|nr:V-set domain containing T-cell activation inhibitor 1-like [Plectropomus leopardus]